MCQTYRCFVEKEWELHERILDGQLSESLVSCFRRGLQAGPQSCVVHSTLCILIQPLYMAAERLCCLPVKHEVAVVLQWDKKNGTLGCKYAALMLPNPKTIWFHRTHVKKRTTYTHQRRPDIPRNINIHAMQYCVSVVLASREGMKILRMRLTPFLEEN